MQLTHTIQETQRRVDAARRGGRRIGLVPTLGYLHEGHLSLIDRCRRSTDFTVVSVFVNPTQFGPREDLEEYPRDLERDRRLLRRRGADLLFAPAISEMYPQEPLIRFEIDRLTDHLCGARRPGHFPGVLLVVAKLLHIIQPDVAMFGQKDLQQLVVVRRMVADLHFPTQIVAAPTVREPDGLAMSSRNSYLSPEQRGQATVLYGALCHAKELIASGERRAEAVTRSMREMIDQVADAHIDYIGLIELERLQPIDVLGGRFALALAVSFGKARLIDNMVLEIEDGEVREIPALA